MLLPWLQQWLVFIHEMLVKAGVPWQAAVAIVGAIATAIGIALRGGR